MPETIEDTPPAGHPRRWRPALPHVDWRPRLRWFAAEFLVVVSGVLVALLLNAWWAGRQEAAREAQLLGRLHEESETVVRYFQHDIASRDALIRSHEAAVAALAPESTAEPDLEAFREGVFFAFTYPPVSPPRSAYDEATGAGLFGSLSSVEVRSAISEYYGRLDEIQNLLAFFRQTAQPGLEMTMEYPFAYDPESDQKMRVLVDPASLREDGRVRNLLTFGLRNQLAFHSFRRSVYEDAVAMCETLAAAVGEECEAARGGAGADRSSS